VRAVNLLPREDRRERNRVSRLPLLVACGGIGVLTVCAAVLALSASSAAAEQRANLSLTTTAIALLPAASPTPSSTQDFAQERADRLSALTAALSTRIAFDRLLRDLSYVLPEDAWLTGLSASAPTGGSTGTPTPAAPPQPQASTGTQNVTIEGATYSQASVARVLARLSALPSLEDVRLASSAQVAPQAPTSDSQKSKTSKRKKARIVVTFTISAALTSGAHS
jgi:Tfp pilus assembly protein PilN